MSRCGRCSPAAMPCPLAGAPTTAPTTCDASRDFLRFLATSEDSRWPLNVRIANKDGDEPQVSNFLELIFQDSRLNVYAGEREVRPPGAPTTPSDIGQVGVRRVTCPAVVDVGELRGAARDDISEQAVTSPTYSRPPPTSNDWRGGSAVVNTNDHSLVIRVLGHIRAKISPTCRL